MWFKLILNSYAFMSCFNHLLVISAEIKCKHPCLCLQELDRFNNLLGVLKRSCSELQRAVKGLAIMSPALEDMAASLINNQVSLLTSYFVSCHRVCLCGELPVWSLICWCLCGCCTCWKELTMSHCELAHSHIVNTTPTLFHTHTHTTHTTGARPVVKDRLPLSQAPRRMGH